MIHIANYEPRIGGGWTAARYLFEAFGGAYEQSHTYLIAGPSMVSYQDVEKARADGKRIVLRVDNALLPSRNRNTGMSRLTTFASMADIVIYQSEWAKDYMLPFTMKNGPVILNGVDTSVFRPGPKSEDSLYVRSSRASEKGWEMSRYWYSRNQTSLLNIVGKFSHENIEYNFDFIGDEKIRFWGEQPRDVIASIMSRSKYFLYSYFMDACSNTLLEARASGCEIIDVYGMLQTGGAPEIMQLEDISVERMIREYKNVLV